MCACNSVKNLFPVLPDTIVDIHTKEWIPKSFDSVLCELEHIISACKQANSLALFRGHRDRKWLLDSTFARSFKTTYFGVPAEQKLPEHVVNSAELHNALLNLFLLKFGVLGGPTAKLEAAAIKHDLDAWFELMKRIQQYPKEDYFHFKGTNFLDWTRSPDVALYFANEDRSGEGAIYICDATATGRSQQVVTVLEILDKIRAVRGLEQSLGAPLLFCPPRQIKNPRARNQQAVYFAQMDLRYDLETIWRLREAEVSDETILIKLVLPAGSEVDTANYLFEKKIVKEFIYPDTPDGVP